MKSIRNACISCMVIVLAWAMAFSPAFAAGNEAVGKAIAKLFSQETVDTGSTQVNGQIDLIKEFYVERNFKPVWTRDSGPKGKAKALVGEMVSSIAHGLSPDYYNYQKIRKLMTSKLPEELARLDLLLSGSFVEFGHDLSYGRLKSDISGNIKSISEPPINAAEYLRGAEKAGNLRNYMTRLLKSDKRYTRLVTKLIEFIRLDQSGQWPVIAGNGKPILAGTRDKRMVQIRKLLVLSGDMPIEAMDKGTKHGKTSLKAVKNYQRRHGIDVSGEINPETLGMMAVPIKTRIGQIKVNLERRRWQVYSVKSDHVYVNLANSSIRLVQNAKTMAAFKVLNATSLGHLPTFLGSLERGAPNSATQKYSEISINSKYISKISGSASNHALVVNDIDKFARFLENYKTPEGQTTQEKVFADNANVPIFVTYVTSWATRDGEIHFRKDIFGRDNTVAKLMNDTQ